MGLPEHLAHVPGDLAMPVAGFSLGCPLDGVCAHANRQAGFDPVVSPGIRKNFLS
jgi:hypothetical protein